MLDKRQSPRRGFINALGEELQAKWDYLLACIIAKFTQLREAGCAWLCPNLDRVERRNAYLLGVLRERNARIRELEAHDE